MLISFILTYIAAFFLAGAKHYFLSGTALILIAVLLYIHNYLKTNNLINLKGLFSLGFIGGEGISCLKLSYLQSDWSVFTWVAFFLAFMGFELCFDLMQIREKKKAAAGNVMQQNVRDIEFHWDRIYICTIVLCVISLISFIIEAALLGYVPLFLRGVPHAYSEFHISGLHYFTVSAVLVPAFSMISFIKYEEMTQIKKSILVAVDLIALLIPVLCVSRFQLAFEIVLAVFSFYLLVQNKLSKENKKKIILCLSGIVILAIAVYLLLSVARSHDVEYLNSIFEMKYDLPIFISHPYIYIANNYDNFNHLLENLPGYSYGLRMLFPLWALTGLKFKFPSLVNYPIYVTKTELTTLTLFYDSYYDFGLPGVMLLSVILGFVAFELEKLINYREDGCASVIYAQFSIYMALSFFTTWFSNPTTAFYFAITLIIYLICLKRK